MRTLVEQPRCNHERRSRLLTRFVIEDSGQDLVEYAFLAAFIGIAGWAFAMSVPDAIGEAYKVFVDEDGKTGAPSLWDPPEPASAGS